MQNFRSSAKVTVKRQRPPSIFGLSTLMRPMWRGWIQTRLTIPKRQPRAMLSRLWPPIATRLMSPSRRKWMCNWPMCCALWLALGRAPVPGFCARRKAHPPMRGLGLLCRRWPLGLAAVNVARASYNLPPQTRACPKFTGAICDNPRGGRLWTGRWDLCI